jgi:hypothetical protein
MKKERKKVIIILMAFCFLAGLGTRDAYADEHYHYKDFTLTPLPFWTDKYFGPNSGDMSYFKISALVKTLNLSRLQAFELQNHFRDLTVEGIISQASFETALQRVREFKFESGLDPVKLDAAPFIVVFDMDETLLQQYYSVWKKCAKCCDYKIKFNNGVRCVSMAPGWEKIIKTIKKLNGLVVIFSANTDDVVWKIVNTVTIENRKLSDYVDGVMTNSYLILQGKYEWVPLNTTGSPVVIPSKDLRPLDETLQKVIIIDDNPSRIIQNYNLRLPKKYQADQYYTDKIARKAYDRQLLKIAEEIEESVTYMNNNPGVYFTRAYLPYTQLGQVALHWLVETGTFTETAAIAYIRKHPNIVDKKF